MGNDVHQFKTDFFKALAHPLRIRILEILSEGEKNVNEIRELVNKEGSSVSQQLSILRSKNIVTGTKKGKFVVYSLSDPMIADLLLVAKEIFVILDGVTGLPSRVILPEKRRYPRIHFNRVVFPAPFSPKRPTISPLGILTFISMRASFAP